MTLSQMTDKLKKARKNSILSVFKCTFYSILTYSLFINNYKVLYIIMLILAIIESISIITNSIVWLYYKKEIQKEKERQRFNKKRFNEEFINDYINDYINQKKKEYQRTNNTYQEQKQYDDYNFNHRSYNNDWFENEFNKYWRKIHEEQNSTSSKIDNAFKLFKLPKTATIEEIKSTYRKLAVKWHPDKWTTDTKENQEIADRNFKKLSVAYDIIKEYKNFK